MMRSAELRDLCVALSEAHSRADAPFIERHVSGQEGVLSIGSDPNEWTEPEYLERIRPKATSVTIGEGETKSVDLKINTAS